MRVLSDSDVVHYLNHHVTKNSLEQQFIPKMVEALTTFSHDPDAIVPPRIVRESNNKNSDTTHLYMPCISPNEVGIKIISGGPTNNKLGLGFAGCVLILDEITGSAKALLNANTLTAFRTALASVSGMTKILGSKPVLPEITVFGVGLQAYWHLKLALNLYGDKITTVNVVNRTLANAEKLSDKLGGEFPTTKFNAFLYQELNHKQEIASHCQNSSIIFGCSPSTDPIILDEYINKDNKYAKFISLIGSYKPHMIELDLATVKRLQASKTSIIVDAKEHCLHEAGELIQGNVTENQLVELTELYGPNGVGNVVDPEINLTVQKLVGLSIMDLSIGKLIVDNVNEEGVVIENF